MSRPVCTDCGYPAGPGMWATRGGPGVPICQPCAWARANGRPPLSILTHNATPFRAANLLGGTS